MKEALTKVLVALDRDDASVDRIMAASFFRARAMHAGGGVQARATAVVIRLDERRAARASS